MAAKRSKKTGTQLRCGAARQGGNGVNARKMWGENKLQTRALRLAGEEISLFVGGSKGPTNALASNQTCEIGRNVGRRVCKGHLGVCFRKNCCVGREEGGGRVGCSAVPRLCSLIKGGGCLSPKTGARIGVQYQKGGDDGDWKGNQTQHSTPAASSLYVPVSRPSHHQSVSRAPRARAGPTGRSSPRARAAPPARLLTVTVGGRLRKGAQPTG